MVDGVMAASSSTYGAFVRYGIPGVALLDAVTAADVAGVGDGNHYLDDFIYYVPIRVNDPINITEFGIYVTIASDPDGVGIIGIYAADVELAPDGSPLPATPIEFALDATGPIASDALDIDLDRGTYLVSWQCDMDVHLRYVTGSVPDTSGFWDATFSYVGGYLAKARTYDGTNPDPGPLPNAVNEPGRGFGFDYPFGMAYTII